MKKIYLIAGLQLLALTLWGQKDTLSGYYVNSAEKLLSTEGNLLIGGYGEVHYNQPLDADVRNVGKLDVHRMVMLFGYQFSNRVQFVTEIEFEHVKEVYIEQAFLQYKINNFLNLRGGLVLIPMGIVNEYHEPTTFNGVERPIIDNRITPTTWREVGVGITGTLLPLSLKYQAYVVNGFNGYDGGPKLKGSSGFRSARQKGAESYMSSPNIATKVEFFGIASLNLGLSGYFGKSQSTLFNGIPKNNMTLEKKADSSVVNISMLGADARYNVSGLQLRGQFYYAGVGNSEGYNLFTADADGTPNNLGSALMGYYLEAAYDVFRNSASISSSLLPFVRYSSYNTHHKVEGDVVPNPVFENQVITTGLTWKMDKGAVVKTDMQFIKSAAVESFSTVFNAGIGVMF